MQSEYREAIAGLRGPDGRPSALYQTYLDHQARYEQKVQARDDAVRQARRNPFELQNWPITGRRFQQEIDAAEMQWSVTGFRREVDAALAVVAAHERAAPTEC